MGEIATARSAAAMIGRIYEEEREECTSDVLNQEIAGRHWCGGADRRIGYGPTPRGRITKASPRRDGHKLGLPGFCVGASAALNGGHS